MRTTNWGRGLWRGLILLCIGLVLIGVGLSLGGEWRGVREFRGFNWDDDGRFTLEGDDMIIEDVEVTQGEIPASITALDLHIKAGSLEIRRGSEGGYRIEGVGLGHLDIDASGSTFRLRQDDWNGAFRFGKNSNALTVVITLPREITFDKVSISIGAGRALIEDLSAGRFELKNGAGSIRASHITADRAVVSSGAGEIEFEKTVFKDATIETGVGRFELKGDITEKAVVTAGIGEVTLTLAGSEKDWRFDFTRGIGEVRIGRDSWTGIGSGSAGSRDAQKHLTLTTGIGAIRVFFDILE